MPARSCTRWVVAAVAVGAVTTAAVAAGRQNAIETASAAAHLQSAWAVDQTEGLPARAVDPLRQQLKSLTADHVGPLPKSWLGAWGGEPQAIRQLETRTQALWNETLAQDRTQAQTTGLALVALEAPWHGLSSTAVMQQVKQERTPRQLAALESAWAATAQHWKTSLQTLSKLGGGLVHNQPRNLVAAAAALRQRLASAPPTVLPTAKRNATDLLSEVAQYLLEPLPQEVEAYPSLIARMHAAIVQLAPPPPPAAPKLKHPITAPVHPPAPPKAVQSETPLGNPFTAGFLHTLASRTSVVAAAVYNAVNGTVYTFNPALQFDTASIVKVTIMGTLLRQSQQLHRPLTTAEAQLMTPMIEISSNSAASTLWNMAGRAAGIGAFLGVAGMTHTVPGRGGYWGLTLTTAPDQVQLMRLFSYPNAVLTPASQTYGLNLMEHVTPGEAWGVSAGPAPGSTVALKNGWLPLGAAGWEINSVGHIVGNGRNYVLAVLSRNNPSEGYGIATVDAVARQVWNALAPKAPAKS